MTLKQFAQICNIIKSGWSNERFTDNADISETLFNSLNRFEFQLVKDTVITMIERGEYEGISYADTISAAKIISKVEAAASAKRNETAYTTWHNSPRCPVCNDEGGTLFTYPTGIEVYRVCNCPAARVKNPWFFQTEQERKEWEEEEHKRGRSTSRAWRCKPEEYRVAYYGGDPEEEKDAQVRDQGDNIQPGRISEAIREVLAHFKSEDKRGNAAASGDTTYAHDSIS